MFKYAGVTWILQLFDGVYVAFCDPLSVGQHGTGTTAINALNICGIGDIKLEFDAIETIEQTEAMEAH